MKIQTVSITIPTAKCVNNCKFCVSKLHNEHLQIEHNNKELKKRLKYASLNGVTTLILTGKGEPLQNTYFLKNLSEVLDKLDNPFPNIELQTSGVLLNEITLKFLKQKMGVTTISLSVSDLFNYENNLKIIGAPIELKFRLDTIIKHIKSEFNMNVRLSINMLSHYENGGKKPKDFFEAAKRLNVDQILFREMWADDSKNKINQWIKSNKVSLNYMNSINSYIQTNGNKLYTLPYGQTVWSLNGISVVIDNDCMSTEKTDENLKYLIIRENLKLYSKWNDKGSLIF